MEEEIDKILEEFYRDELPDRACKAILHLIQSLRKSDMEAVEEMINDNLIQGIVRDESGNFIRTIDTINTPEMVSIRSKLKEYRAKNNLE